MFFMPAARRLNCVKIALLQRTLSDSIPATQILSSEEGFDFGVATSSATVGQRVGSQPSKFSLGNWSEKKIDKRFCNSLAPCLSTFLFNNGDRIVDGNINVGT